MKTQILELEKEYWQGMENHDYETVKKLTRFPCIVAGKNGVQSVDEGTFKKMFDSGAGANLKVMNISDVEMQKTGKNSAVIAYLVELGISGSKEKTPMKCACTSAWVKEDDHWTCALHTESELAS